MKGFGFNIMKEIKNKESVCACADKRTKARGSEEKKRLINRISRIGGQINAVKRMIEEDAYCPDILLQISAADSALRALSRIMMTEHINTCVLQDIKSGKEDAADELAVLIEKMSK